MMDYIAYGRGSGQGLVCCQMTNGIQNFVRTHEKELMELAETRLNGKELLASIYLDKKIIVLFSRVIQPDPNSARKESRPYTFTQMYCMDTETYWKSIAGRMAAIDFSSYFYQGTDFPMEIREEELSGENLLKAPNRGLECIGNLTPEERLAYAYMGMEMLKGKQRKGRYSQRFTFREMVSVMTLLLPIESVSRLTYVEGGKINLPCNLFPSQKEGCCIEMLWGQKRQEAEEFFKTHSFLRLAVMESHEERVELYQWLAQLSKEKGKLYPTWEWYEAQYWNAKQSANQKLYQGEENNLPQNAEESFEEETSNMNYDTVNESSYSDPELEEKIATLIEENTPKSIYQLRALSRELYRENPMAASHCQALIRTMLVEIGWQRKRKHQIAELLLLSCEMLPDDYENTWKRERFKNLPTPIDFALFEQTIDEICEHKIRRKRVIINCIEQTMHERWFQKYFE